MTNPPSPPADNTEIPTKTSPFCGLGLNSSIVPRAIGYPNDPAMYHILYSNAVSINIFA